MSNYVVVSTEYAGKLYLAPTSEHRKYDIKAGDILVFLNFGWMSKDTQQFPPYRATIMEPLFTRPQYEKLKVFLRGFIGAKGLSVLATQRMLSCAAIPGLGCCITPTLANNKSTILYGLKSIVRDFSKEINQDLLLEFFEISSFTDKGDPGLDESNKVVSTIDANGTDTPSWPPLGLNLIFHIPGERANWSTL
jgi:hypothetical protein